MEKFVASIRFSRTALQQVLLGRKYKSGSDFDKLKFLVQIIAYGFEIDLVVSPAPKMDNSNNQKIKKSGR